MAELERATTMFAHPSMWIVNCIATSLAARGRSAKGDVHNRHKPHQVALRASGAAGLYCSKVTGRQGDYQSMREGVIMTQEDLERRVKRLEDIEAIRDLMWNYTYCLDYGDVQGVVDRFQDDAKFQVRMRAGEQKGRLVGRYDGKENISALYAVAHQKEDVYPASAHVITNPVVTVEGDRAKGSCYLLGTFPGGATQGRYDNEFVRVGDQWKIASFRLTWNFVPEGMPTRGNLPVPEPLGDDSES